MPSVDHDFNFLDIHWRDFLRCAGIESYFLDTKAMTGAITIHGRRHMLCTDDFKSAISSFFSFFFMTHISFFFFDLEIVFLFDTVDFFEVFGVF